uniref:GDT1 family protein n=1 Tax=Tetraselmis sp. GSL018 TaxID=582737 RepID=A0A061S2S8_9CHLO
MAQSSTSFTRPAFSLILALCFVNFAVARVDPGSGGDVKSAEGRPGIVLDPQVGLTGVHKTVIDLRDRKDSPVDTAEKTDPSILTALTHSFAMILVTEVGDETFIIAALMAMRHPKSIVYAGAMTALTFMTVISTAMGYIVPHLISRKTTEYLATTLYIFFGSRLFYIAYRSSSEHVEEEMHEVEEKLGKTSSQTLYKRVLSRFLTPIFLESMILTFLAEWGDRSQIATISLAAHHNPYGVTVGAIVGHCICTGTAVVGGSVLAQKISQRAVAICGGTLFFLFAAHNFFWGHAGA